MLQERRFNWVTLVCTFRKPIITCVFVTYKVRFPGIINQLDMLEINAIDFDPAVKISKIFGINVPSIQIQDLTSF